MAGTHAAAAAVQGHAVPPARPQLIVGVNQVIMLSLNMVIIASMIGAGGLGYDVLAALRRLDIGAGLEAGLAIVVLAIALDRLSQAYASRAAAGHDQDRSLPASPSLRSPLAVYGAGLFLPAVATYPASLQISTAPWWGEAVRWFNVHFFDTIDAIKSALLLNVLIPVKRFMLAQPWPSLPRRSPSPAGALADGGLRRSSAPSRCSSPERAVGKGDGKRLSGRDLGHRRGGDRHSARHPRRPFDRALAHSRSRHRHAADPAELRLPDHRWSCCSGSAISPP